MCSLHQEFPLFFMTAFVCVCVCGWALCVFVSHTLVHSFPECTKWHVVGRQCCLSFFLKVLSPFGSSDSMIERSQKDSVLLCVRPSSSLLDWQIVVCCNYMCVSRRSCVECYLKAKESSEECALKCNSLHATVSNSSGQNPSFVLCCFRLVRITVVGKDMFLFLYFGIVVIVMLY